MRLALALGALVMVLGGCDRREGPSTEGFKTLHVGDAVALRGRGAILLDANGADTRAREGVVAGAVLLSNYKAYDAAKELPASKATPLVFYCANEH
jgi:hypothetical protein